MSTDLAMVAVDKQRIILLVKNKAQDRLHGLDRNGLFLGPLHIEDMMFDAIGIDKTPVSRWEVLLDKSAGKSR